MLQSLARPLLSAMFVVGGLDAVRSPDNKIEQADWVIEKVRSATGIRTDSKRLVQLNGAAQIAGGALLSIGEAPRTAALVLALSLVPTTLAGHRYWELSGHDRDIQKVHFLKNLAMLGGLLSLADTHRAHHAHD